MRVYHFTHTSHAISDLALRRLKVARCSELNDPFELLAPRLKDKILRRAMLRWKDKRNRDTGFLCFSRDWKPTLLWSHYAQGHRGVCLGFDLDDDLAKEVHYRSTRLDLDLAPDEEPRGDLEDALLRTKGELWSYEKEIRVIIRLREAVQEGGLYFYPFNKALKLREVGLGALCETPIEEIGQFLARSGFHDFNVWKARLANKWFEVAHETLWTANGDVTSAISSLGPVFNVSRRGGAR